MPPSDVLRQRRASEPISIRHGETEAFIVRNGDFETIARENNYDRKDLANTAFFTRGILHREVGLGNVIHFSGPRRVSNKEAGKDGFRSNRSWITAPSSQPLDADDDAGQVFVYLKEVMIADCGPAVQEEVGQLESELIEPIVIPKKSIRQDQNTFRKEERDGDRNKEMRRILEALRLRIGDGSGFVSLDSDEEGSDGRGWVPFKDIAEEDVYKCLVPLARHDISSVPGYMNEGERCKQSNTAKAVGIYSAESKKTIYYQKPVQLTLDILPSDYSEMTDGDLACMVRRALLGKQQ